jgi:hypothetical protein
MFFNLIRKEQMNQRLASSLDVTIDAPQLVGRVTQMVRGFAVTNLIIGSAVEAATVLVLLALRVQGAVVLGIVSGFLSLTPFLGVAPAVLILLRPCSCHSGRPVRKASRSCSLEPTQNSGFSTGTLFALPMKYPSSGFWDIKVKTIDRNGALSRKCNANGGKQRQL